MKPKNTSNTQEKLHHVVAQVLSILGENKKGASISAGTYRDQIDHIMKENTDAKSSVDLALYLINEVDVSYFHKMSPSVRDNKKVALAALRRDSSIFVALKPQYQLQFQFAQEAIKSLVREKVSFLEVKKFLEKHITDVKLFKRLFSFYKSYLKVAEYIFHSDIERQLIQLQETDAEFLNLMLGKKLLEQQGKKIVLSSKFVQFFLGEIKAISGYSEKSQEEKDALMTGLFQNYLGLSTKDMTEQRVTFLRSVATTIHIKKDTQDGEKQSPEKEKKPEKSEKTKQEQEEEEIEERLEFCIPYCRYSVGSSGDCDIQLGNDTHIHLSQKELDTIGNTALQNYIAAVKLFQDIGLGFAMNYKEQFFRLCDVDYLYGEGLSEGKILKILNKVGKKLGIPEQKIVEKTEDGEEKTEPKVGCFNTYGEAVYQFRQIRDTGKINGEQIVDLGKKGTKSVAQIDLIQKGFFSDEGKGFQKITQW